MFTFESLIADAYVGYLSDEEVTAVADVFAPVRGYAEERLEDYDPDECHWRDYRNMLMDEMHHYLSRETGMSLAQIDYRISFLLEVK